MMDNQITKKIRLSLLGLIALAGITLSMNSCYYDNDQELYQFVQNNSCDTTTVTYSTIASIMSAYNCNGCHNTSVPNGAIITDNYTDLKAAAQSGALLRSVNWTGSIKMPQGGNKLTDCEIARVQVWINRQFPN